jgi:hypothetical protein
MGVGGRSTDLSLVSASNNLLIGLFEKTGYNFTWMNEVTTANPTLDLVSQILFKADDSNLVALIGGVSPFQILVIDALVGTVLSKIKDNGYLSGLGGTIAIDPVSNYIFLAGTLPGSYRLSIIALDILINPASTGPFATMQLSSNNYVAYSMALDTTQRKLYIGAACQDSSCISLIETPFSGALFFGTSQLSQITQQYNNPKVSIWADSALFYVAEGLATNYGILIWRKDLNPTVTTEGYIYKEGSPD